MATAHFVQVVFPLPKEHRFDYRVNDTDRCDMGQRVRVPFGQRTRIGMVIKQTEATTQPINRIKTVLEWLDPEPLLSPSLLQWLQWTAQYYQQSLGQLVFAAIPPALRQGQAWSNKPPQRWQVTTMGAQVRADALKRAPKQWQALSQLQQGQQTQIPTAILKTLQKKGWVTLVDVPIALPANPKPAPHTLTDEQQIAIDRISSQRAVFHTWLLQGITGSGKTEVYIQLIQQMIQQGRQCLVMIPEISLTPQTIARFQARLHTPVAVIHSHVTPNQRLQAWVAAKTGRAQLVIGTRSAVFSAFADLGLIIIDEEHDPSFKQQEQCRYSARDAAIKRAQLLGIPIILGSATPALETWHNAQVGRYQHLVLSQRPGAAQPPKIQLINLQQHPPSEGLSQPLSKMIAQHLAQQQQVLLFVNRRGFAPVLLCTHCAWSARCDRCQSHMVYHRQNEQLRCHHCDRIAPYPKQCEQCGQTSFKPLGMGTQRIEAALSQRFPTIPLLRLDRDSLRRQGSLEQQLDQIQTGQPMLLLGTQLLAKGHHFPKVTLVGIIDADQGLLSHDFRATERLGQLLVQVSGRAGRSDSPGQVLIQTHYPDHPLLQLLLQSDYDRFLQTLRQQRQAAQLPPYSHQALFRSEASTAQQALAGLQTIKERCLQCQPPAELQILGPVPAPMEKRHNQWRCQLLLQSTQRSVLSTWLPKLMPTLWHPPIRICRWSLDVDPIDLF